MNVGDKVRLVGAVLQEYEKYSNLEGTIIQYHPDFEQQWPFVVSFENEFPIAVNRDELELVEVK